MSIVPTGAAGARGPAGGPSPEPAAPYRFDVVVDGVSIGSFTACEGLAAEYETEPYREGGANTVVHRLPGRLTYSNIRLSRVLDGSSAGDTGLAGWFSRLDQGSSRASMERTVGITAYTAGGQQVASWSLHGALPVKWTGPSFASDGSGVAKETIEFVHQGFM